jgi:tRNA dimethylallyltransferase
MDSQKAKVVVVAGPTASGKSALALAVAEVLQGTIINADSQQCYVDLPSLTARPTGDELARVPHRLFGELSPTAKDSAAAWAKRAATAIHDAHAVSSVPIIVGGTGLYLHALMKGMPGMPEIAPAVREQAHALLLEIGHDQFHARLAALDPDAAQRIKIGDTQRMLRAWEVSEGTGRPLSAWQADPPRRPIDADYFSILLLPPRSDVVASADERFDRMVAAGAVEEVRALLTRGVGPMSSIFRVLGAKPFARHIAGEIDLATAVTLAKTATRQYAKRQSTWFRHQFFADFTLFTKFSESMTQEIFSKIRRFVLT